MYTLVGILVVYVLVCSVIAVKVFFSEENQQLARLGNRYQDLTGRVKFYQQRIRATQLEAGFYVNSMGSEETRALYELHLLNQVLTEAISACRVLVEQKEISVLERMMDGIEAGEFIRDTPGVAIQPCGAWEPKLDQILTGVERKVDKAKRDFSHLCGTSL